MVQHERSEAERPSHTTGPLTKFICSISEYTFMEGTVTQDEWADANKGYFNTDEEENGEWNNSEKNVWGN